MPATVQKALEVETIRQRPGPEQVARAVKVNVPGKHFPQLQPADCPWQEFPEILWEICCPCQNALPEISLEICWSCRLFPAISRKFTKRNLMVGWRTDFARSWPCWATQIGFLGKRAEEGVPGQGRGG